MYKLKTLNIYATISSLNYCTVREITTIKLKQKKKKRTTTTNQRQKKNNRQVVRETRRRIKRGQQKLEQIELGVSSYFKITKHNS